MIAFMLYLALCMAGLVVLEIADAVALAIGDWYRAEHQGQIFVTTAPLVWEVTSKPDAIIHVEEHRLSPEELKALDGGPGLARALRGGQ